MPADRSLAVPPALCIIAAAGSTDISPIRDF
jgi:hypothetical protein